MSAVPGGGSPNVPAIAPTVVAVALALLLGLQPLSTDVYLPALPMLARDLAAPMSAVQLTMSALILAFGVAHLVWGPVADRFGRRPVLLVGLGLYTAASVGAMLAPDIGTLVLARVVQGATLAAAVVCARAIVRDLYDPHRGAHVMSLALSGLGVIAVTGPAFGGGVTAWLGWRGTLGAVALGGAAVWLFIWRALPETHHARNPHATRIAPLAAVMRTILRHHTFVAWTGLISASYGGLFTILAASSFVYIDVLGLSPAAYGLAMASGSLCYLLGTFVCRRWLLKYGLTGAVKRGALFTLAGGVSVAAFAAAGVQAVWAILVPQWLFMLGHGIHQPCGQTGAVGPFPHAAGVASALAGFVLALVAFGIGLWLGRALDGTVRALAYGLAFWALVVVSLAWTLVQRHGAARAPAAA